MKIFLNYFYKQRQLRLAEAAPGTGLDFFGQQAATPTYPCDALGCLVRQAARFASSSAVCLASFLFLIFCLRSGFCLININTRRRLQAKREKYQFQCSPSYSLIIREECICLRLSILSFKTRRF